MDEHWRIGKLASSSGLSLRTLRYWDALGLLSPSGRTESGHRMYAPQDVERLYRVLALRSLGLSLESIATCLDGDIDLDGLVTDHLHQVDRQLAELSLLRDRLAHVVDALAEHRSVTSPALLDAVRAIRQVDDEVIRRFLDPEQIAVLADAAAGAGPAARYQLDIEWPQLYRQAEALLADDVPVTDDAAQRTVARIDQLRQRFSGGDPAISRQVRAAWAHAPAELSGQPEPPGEQWAAVTDYLDRARDAARDQTSVPTPSGE